MLHGEIFCLLGVCKQLLISEIFRRETIKNIFNSFSKLLELFQIFKSEIRHLFLYYTYTMRFSNYIIYSESFSLLSRLFHTTINNRKHIQYILFAFQFLMVKYINEI